MDRDRNLPEAFVGIDYDSGEPVFGTVKDRKFDETRLPEDPVMFLGPNDRLPETMSTKTIWDGTGLVKIKVINYGSAEEMERALFELAKYQIDNISAQMVKIPNFGIPEADKKWDRYHPILSDSDDDSDSGKPKSRLAPSTSHQIGAEMKARIASRIKIEPESSPAGPSKSRAMTSRNQSDGSLLDPIVLSSYGTPVGKGCNLNKLADFQASQDKKARKKLKKREKLQKKKQKKRDESSDESSFERATQTPLKKDPQKVAKSRHVKDTSAIQFSQEEASATIRSGQDGEKSYSKPYEWKQRLLFRRLSLIKSGVVPANCWMTDEVSFLFNDYDLTIFSTDCTKDCRFHLQMS